jgi:hypothetical protein
MGHVADHRQVDRAVEERVVGQCTGERINAAPRLRDRPLPHRRHHRAHRRVALEPAADSEEYVAEDLGIEAARRHAPQQLVVGIDGAARGSRRRREAVDPRRHQPAHQPLHAPAVGHEPTGQRVEQFGMGRGPAAGAEVVGRGDEAAAEEVQPDAVDRHPRRERIVGGGDPVGQFAAATCFRRDRQRRAVQGRQCPARHRAGARRCRLAALVEGAVADHDGAVVREPARTGPAPTRRLHTGGLVANRHRARLRGAVGLVGVEPGLEQRQAPGGEELPERIADRGQALARRRDCRLEAGAFRGRKGGRPGRRIGLRRQRDERCRSLGVDERHGAVAGLGAPEDPRQRRIVGLRDRIGLVVVAAGTGDGETEKRLRRHVDLLVGGIELVGQAAALVEGAGTDGEESGGDRQ